MKTFQNYKNFYKTKGLPNFNHRFGKYYTYFWMDYGRKGFEMVRVKSIISENCGHIYWHAIGLNGTENSIVKVK